MVFPLVSILLDAPPRLATVFIAMLPIFELRGAIPYAFGRGLSWHEAYLFAVAGNFIPVIPILFLLERVSNILMKRYSSWDRFFTWLFKRTRRKGKLIERFETLGLVLFVAIPLPVTGAWTGCVAAYLFKIPRKLAIPAIIGGILIAGAVVSLACLGVISFLGITTIRSTSP